MNRTLGITKACRFMGPCWLVFIGALLITPANVAAEGTENQPGWDKQQWREDLLAARAARTKEMATARFSMLAAVDHVWHTGSETLYFDLSPKGFSYAKTQSPDTKVVMTLAGEHWEWRPLDSTVSVTYRGKPAEPGRLQPGMVFSILERYSFMTFAGLAGNLQVAVFDNERAAQKNFTGLVHYAPDDRYRLEAGLERFEDAETVKMLTNISGERDFIKYGAIRFTIDGQSQRLTVYKDEAGEKRLFIPFRDETAGKTTYGAGRFLSAAEPEDGDSVIVDFNYAVNIPCAYAPRFHCPLPPSENWLQVAVAAGEQIFPLPD